MPSEAGGREGLDESWCSECPFHDLPFSDPITEAELALVEIRGAPQNAQPGAVLIQAGDPASPVYLLASGRAVRSNLLPNGREVILQQLFPGDVVGYGAAFLGIPPHYSVTALTAVSFRVLDRKRVGTLHATAPEFAHKLMWQLVRRDRTVDFRLLSLGRRTADEQLAGMLLFTYARLHTLGLLKGAAFNLALSQQQIADFLGVHVVHINRVLRRLREAGLVEVQRGEVRILDPAGLRRLGCFCANSHSVPLGGETQPAPPGQ